VTDELIEMTDWELQDFAVQAVHNDLMKNGRKILSSQSNPMVDPSIWFIGVDTIGGTVAKVGMLESIRPT